MLRVRPATSTFHLCRIDAQRLPHYLEEEAEDLGQKIGDAWNKLAAMPPGTVAAIAAARQLLVFNLHSCNDDAVAKVVASAQPPVEYTCGKYREAHHALVSSAAYNRALDIADGVVKRVQVSDHSWGVSLRVSSAA